MRCAWTCFLIKTSFLFYTAALSWALSGGGRREGVTFSSFLPALRCFTPGRWFCWAPVASHWPNRLLHSSRVPVRSEHLCYPLPISLHMRVHAPYDQEMRSKALSWLTKCICRYLKPVCEKLASPFLKLYHYYTILKMLICIADFPVG